MANDFPNENSEAFTEFVRQISELERSIKELVESNQAILSSNTGRIRPPVGGTNVGARTGYDPERDLEEAGLAGSSRVLNRKVNPDQTPFAQRNRSQRAAKGRSIGLNPHVNSDDVDYGDEPSSESSDGSGSPLRTLKNLIAGQNQSKLNASVAEASNSSIRLPRYGEFNFQDVMHLLGNPMGSVANALANANNTGEGPLASFAQSTPGRAITTGLGYGSRVTDMLSNVSPYVKAFGQFTGIPTSPGGLNAMGTAMGYSQGGTDVGPFRIPGLGIGLGGISVSPAMKQGLQNGLQALTYGLMPGGSSKAMVEMQNALQSYGYSGSQMRDMAGVYGDVARNQEYGNIGSAQDLAPVMDQMFRYGGGSLSSLKTALEGLGTAALAANQSVASMTSGLNSYAQQQASTGGTTYTAAFLNGENLSNSTGFTPEALSQLQSSPLTQAYISQATGLPIYATQLASQSDQLQAMHKNVATYYNAAIAAGQSPSEAAAFASGPTGLPVGQIEEFMNKSKYNAMLKTTQLTASTQALVNNSTSGQSNYKNMSTKQRLAVIQKDENLIRKRNGKTAEEEFASRLGYTTTASRLGSRFGGTTTAPNTSADALNSAYSNTLRDADWDSLRKQAEAAGMSKSEWQKLSHHGTGFFGTSSAKDSLSTINNNLKGWAAKRDKGWAQSAGDSSTNAAVSVNIKGSPQLLKLLGISSTVTQNAVNNGQTSANSQYGTSQLPSGAQYQTLDPYSGTG